MEEEVAALVVDNGSGRCKAGFVLKTFWTHGAQWAQKWPVIDLKNYKPT